MKNRTFGYARVSSRDQNLDRQLVALADFGIEKTAIFADRASGKDFERPAYQALLETIRPGDVIVVKSIDRLGRSYDQILEEWRRLTKTLSCSIVVLDMPLLDTRENRGITGRLISDIVLQLLSYVAQQEREFIRQRQREGIAAAHARGVRFGRPPKQRPSSYAKIKARHLAGKTTKREAAASLQVSITTFEKWLKEDERAKRQRAQPSLF